jgi:ADP-heptose:LPS heptosyltransferase
VKILVISLAGIGDTLLATPLIHELRLNFPTAIIDVFTKESGARDLLENNPYINRVHYKNLLRCGKMEGLGFIWSLRKNGYDLTINTHPQSRMVYRAVARMIGAQTRISHEYECFHWLDRKLCNRILPQDYARHSIENNLDVLTLIGARKILPKHELEVFLKAKEEKWAETYLAENYLGGGKLLGMHVGSGGTKNLPLKRWPINRYAELVETLNRERRDLQVLLFGGPEETQAHQMVLARGDRNLTREIKTPNLRLAAALIKRCSAFLSVDTALMHLAAAVGTPNQMVIEAPTLNVTNWPHGNSSVVIPNPMVNGRGLDFYRYDGGDIKGTREELIRIMESVKVADVYKTIIKLI